MPSLTQKPPLRLLIVGFLYVLIFPVLLFLLSGDWGWLEAWIFSVWFLILCYSTILYIYHNDPELLVERYRRPGSGKQPKWDQYTVYALVVGFVAWIVVMPLDARRFHWSPSFSLWLQGAGMFLLLFSAFFFFRSYLDNAFLSPLVRIQEDRGQRLVSEGVYGFVRHPMYLGAVLLFLGVPLLLGSILGLVIGFFLILVVAQRILGEERLLVQELEGYGAYRDKVRYRLIPPIW
jgi:protein-S-isoprenylcysteine O-methyltransferase Ste14